MRVEASRRAALREFSRAIAELNHACAVLREWHPEANLYLAADTLHLLSGPSHDDMGTGGLKARRDRSIISGQLRNAGGGDW